MGQHGGPVRLGGLCRRRRHLVPRIAQDVEHDDRPDLRGTAQRQPRHHARLLLELAAVGRIQRPVARVVRAWRHLVGQQPAIFQHKELDAQDAAVRQPLGQADSGGTGLLGQRRRHGSRHGADRQDALPVLVGSQRVDSHLAIGTARQQYRDLGRQRHLLLQHTDRRPAGSSGREALKGVTRCLTCGHAGLALAVIAQPRHLQDGREQRVGHTVNVFKGLDDPIRGHRHASPREEGLLGHPILGHGHRGAGGRDPGEHGQPLQRGRRHVLEFGGDGVAERAQLHQRSVVQIVGANVMIGHPGGDAVGIRVQHTDTIAQPLGGLAEHPAQLAAAQHTQPAARGQRLPVKRCRRRGRLIERQLRRPAVATGWDIGHRGSSIWRAALVWLRR